MSLKSKKKYRELNVGDEANIDRPWWQTILGRPLKISDSGKESLIPITGLAALSLDALSSVAYGPEAIIYVLAAAGSGALRLLQPITWVIVFLLVILIISYRQVIEVFPHGGGSYAVSSTYLGPLASKLAAASLIVDYVLTVAVSIAAGVGALISAFPILAPDSLILSLAILAIVTFANLRGVGESARAFIVPTLVFIVGLLVIIAIGLISPSYPHGYPAMGGNVALGTQTIGILLILKAFSAGCSALTGVEAIANGVPLFREPRVKRAKNTELLLGIILGIMLLGLAHLGVAFGVRPNNIQTSLSEIMSASVGRGWLYYTVDLATTVILALAANTSFGGLPILASLLAKDNRLPHLFSIRGDRLVYNYGVIVLAGLSAVLLIASNSNTNALIPLYAIGVFTGFTLAQLGLVIHWKKNKPNNWLSKALLNGLGSLLTFVATIIFLITKFSAGAWVVVVAIPLFMFMFGRISTYYSKVAQQVGLGKIPAPLKSTTSHVIVPINNVSRLSWQALSSAVGFGEQVIAVHIEFEDTQDTSGDLIEKWDQWNPGVPLVILKSQYHSVTRPLLRYVNSLNLGPDEGVVILIPELIARRLRHRILQNQTGLILSYALRKRTDVVVARMGFHLKD